MTLKYLGIHPESAYKGSKYEKHLHHTSIVKGKEVAYYEVVELDEPNVNVSMSSVRKTNKLFLELV